MTRQFLLASDFDQTLSFNDSGVVLSTSSKPASASA